MEHIVSIKEAATRPDFIKLLSTGLKTSFFDAYGKTESEYEQVVSTETSTKDKEDYPILSEIGEPEKVLEGEEYGEDTNMALGNQTITNYKYGKIIAITREMVDDDQTRRIAQKPKELGKKHRDYENRLVFSSIVTTRSAVFSGDTNLFQTSHYNRTGGAAYTANDNVYTSVTLSAGALIVAMDMITKWKGINNEDINVTPTKIMAPFRLGYTANWLAGNGGIPAYAANVLGAGSAYANLSGSNPIQANLGVIVSKWLSKLTSSTYALDWYLLTDVPGIKFQIRDPLELYAEGDLSTSWFEKDVMRWKSRKRLGYKIIDWRSIMLIS